MSKKELEKVLEEDAKRALLAEGKDSDDDDSDEDDDDVKNTKDDEKDGKKKDKKEKSDKDEDDDKDDDDKKEFNFDKNKVKKEAFRPEDQPATQTKDDPTKVVPGGKAAPGGKGPHIAGTDPTTVVPGSKGKDDKSTPYNKVKESVEMMFEGVESLSPEFRMKAETIFEAALSEKIAEEKARIQEELEAEFEAKYNELEKTLSENINEYMDYAINEWAEQNKVAIVTSKRLEIAEDFLNDMKEIFEKHNINIPEDKVDLLEEAENTVADLTTQVNELTEKVMSKEKEILEFQKEKFLTDLSEGLADTQKEKLKTLVEGVEAKDIDTFKEKAKIVKESYFKNTNESDKTDSGEPLVESKKELDPNVKRYIEHARQYTKK